MNSNNCTLTFDSTGTIAGQFFAIPLMVEDFYDQSRTIPYSSVPNQFLIEIIDTPSCSPKPVITSTLSQCTAVRVGVQFSFTISIAQGCSGTLIDDVFRVPPLNMVQGTITQVGTSTVWSVDETWTPTDEQVDLQVYCAVATDK